VWKGKFTGAGLAFVGLIPYIGDGTKGVRLLADFAKKSDRAADAVREVVPKIQLPNSAKEKILSLLPSTVGRLPRQLRDGPKKYMVYTSPNYIGITSDFNRRVRQHARAGRGIAPTPMQGAENLSLGQARSIEQACIEQVDSPPPVDVS